MQTGCTSRPTLIGLVKKAQDTEYGTYSSHTQLSSCLSFFSRNNPLPNICTAHLSLLQLLDVFHIQST